jgi:drug/metabolite transporter (DMT)-like permease
VAIPESKKTIAASPAQQSPLAPLSLAAAGCLWGTGFFFGKIAFHEMSVAENVTFRFLCGSIFLLPVLLKHWTPFRRNELWLVLAAAVIGVPIQFLIQFKGLALTTVSHASLIVATLPVLLAVGSALFLHERLRRVEWAILLLSACGATLIALSGRHSGSGPQPTLRGDMLVFLSMIAAVVMILITKHLVARHNSLQITASTIIMGTIFLTVGAEIWTPLRFHFSSQVWAAVAAQGILATSGAYLLWNWGLTKMSASRSGVFLNLEPVVGTFLGLFLLHETLGLTAVLGGIMIIGSAIYFSRRTAE